MRTFGLTGGIASGKSSVATIFRGEGVPVVDADEVARAVVAKGSEGLTAVVGEFGEQVLTAAGELDRKALGGLVFADPAARVRLEAVVHPRIARESARRFAELGAAGHGIACYDAALLVERGLADGFRPLVVVAAPRELQVSRLMARDRIDRGAAEARLGAQASMEAKLAAADHVVWNDADFETLRQRALAVLEEVRKRLAAPAAPVDQPADDRT